MNRTFVIIALFALATLYGCSPKQMQVKVTDIKDYDEKAAEHILFLNFEIQKNNSGREKVSLKSIQSGNGKLKDSGNRGGPPGRIEAVADYGRFQPVKETFVPHPLRRDVEIPSENGSLETRLIEEEKGDIFLRIQEDKNLEKLSLYSTAPGRERLLIYTIHFKR